MTNHPDDLAEEQGVPKRPMPGEIITPDDLAEKLGVPKRTVYDWRHRGVGPTGFRVGRHIRYRRQDVDAWIDQQIAAERMAS